MYGYKNNLKNLIDAIIYQGNENSNHMGEGDGSVGKVLVMST